MTTPDSRIVLRGYRVGEGDDLIEDHPGQPADYVHRDGTVWTWQDRWRVVGSAHLRLYDPVAPGSGETDHAPQAGIQADQLL
jgi:hypothetical protein